MSLPVSGHLSLPILILTGIPSLCCHLNRLIYVIFKSLSHLRQPQLSAAPLKREHQVAVCCSCNPGQISLMPLWAGRAGGSRGQSPAGTVAPCPPRWGMPRKTRPALLGASLLADNGQWRQNRKCSSYLEFLHSKLPPHQPPSQRVSGFISVLWNMYNTDWGNNNLTFKVMKQTGSQRDIKATKRQIRVKREKEKKKREKIHS